MLMAVRVLEILRMGEDEDERTDDRNPVARLIRNLPFEEHAEGDEKERGVHAWTRQWPVRRC